MHLIGINEKILSDFKLSIKGMGQVYRRALLQHRKKVLDGVALYAPAKSENSPASK
tara:strand:+ start:773 stop:940 length:168 start_codon:yes stop_codon:yes gene_type:complete